MTTCKTQADKGKEGCCSGAPSCQTFTVSGMGEMCTLCYCNVFASSQSQAAPPRQSRRSPASFAAPAPPPPQASSPYPIQRTEPPPVEEFLWGQWQDSLISPRGGERPSESSAEIMPHRLDFWKEDEHPFHLHTKLSNESINPFLTPFSDIPPPDSAASPRAASECHSPSHAPRHQPNPEVDTQHVLGMLPQLMRADLWHEGYVSEFVQLAHLLISFGLVQCLPRWVSRRSSGLYIVSPSSQELRLQSNDQRCMLSEGWTRWLSSLARKAHINFDPNIIVTWGNEIKDANASNMGCIVQSWFVDMRKLNSNAYWWSEGYRYKPKLTREQIYTSTYEGRSSNALHQTLLFWHVYTFLCLTVIDFDGNDRICGYLNVRRKVTEQLVTFPFSPEGISLPSYLQSPVTRSPTLPDSPMFGKHMALNSCSILQFDDLRSKDAASRTEASPASLEAAKRRYLFKVPHIRIMGVWFISIWRPSMSGAPVLNDLPTLFGTGHRYADASEVQCMLEGVPGVFAGDT